MKKLIGISLIAIIVLAFGFTNNASAQIKSNVKTENANYRINFVDANGDGICDNTGLRSSNGKGNARVSGRNFVDTDGDGVCDNNGKNRQKVNKGNGSKHGNGNGYGRSNNKSKIK